MTRLLQDSINDIEAIEDFQGAALEAICMTDSDTCVALVYYTSLDAATSHPESGHEPVAKDLAICQNDFFLPVFGYCLPSGPGANDQSAVALAEVDD